MREQLAAINGGTQLIHSPTTPRIAGLCSLIPNVMSVERIDAEKLTQSG
jgi:hypothetical protein